MGAVLAGQYDEKRAPFLIDFSIRTASIPKVSYVDVLRGDEATLNRLKGKKVIIGGTALELGDRFSVPNGGLVFRTAAADARRRIDPAEPRAAMDLRYRHAGRPPAACAGDDADLAPVVRRQARRCCLCGWRPPSRWALSAAGGFPLILDTSLFHTAIAVYMAAIALDEIDFRDVLGRIAENRFQRIAMSLGDGLVCTDSNHLITVWNPGAAAIFGYRAEEMIGKPLDMICARDAASRPARSRSAKRAASRPLAP